MDTLDSSDSVSFGKGVFLYLHLFHLLRLRLCPLCWFDIWSYYRSRMKLAHLRNSALVPLKSARRKRD